MELIEPNPTLFFAYCLPLAPAARSTLWETIGVPSAARGQESGVRNQESVKNRLTPDP